MTQYFSKFPKVAYDITGTTQFNLATDIIHRAKFREVVKKATLIWYPYTVKDGETPEIIAHKLYGSSQYHWLVLFANDIFLIWQDWPLSYSQFIDHLTKKYGDPDTAMATHHHYEDADGNWIDQDTYAATVGEGSHDIDAYVYEDQVNEAKRDIRLIDAKYVNVIEEELDKILKPTKR